MSYLYHKLSRLIFKEILMVYGSPFDVSFLFLWAVRLVLIIFFLQENQYRIPHLILRLFGVRQVILDLCLK